MYIEVADLRRSRSTSGGTPRSGLIHHLCLNIFFVTTITTVIWNANPLMRFDGYYMMSDFLEIPNLRPKADRLLRDWFGWYCLGIEAKPDPVHARKRAGGIRDVRHRRRPVPLVHPGRDSWSSFTPS